MIDSFAAYAISSNNPDVPVIEFRHPPCDEVDWLIAADADGEIVRVDRDFNVHWSGDEQEARARLSKLLVLREQPTRF